MNRWWGSSQDSDRQASEQNSRAARRTIASLHIPSDEDDFHDCDTSGLFPKVDGEGGDVSLDSDIMPNVTPFQDEKRR